MKILSKSVTRHHREPLGASPRSCIAVNSVESCEQRIVNVVVVHSEKSLAIKERYYNCNLNLVLVSLFFIAVVFRLKAGSIPAHNLAQLPPAGHSTSPTAIDNSVFV